ncbi:phage head morphogenesis protein [Rodentibacter trehalosifermentans]|uniref:Phage head morphogenesis protein n=1 Tax=Rodentibacter trehalosifermentans TaxID=1908263 RepID=A0A1V3IX84_9PAST|nr:phage minor head protein [Rodentibacter trehalosifermentans]OOF46933.1 phage head morphogenesis protein [Rodentibacter trehalosifermentans]
MPNLSFALGLPPKKAIEFLKSKKAFLDHIDEKGLMESARAKAARIANLSSLEMMKDIYQSLIEAQQQGQPFVEWQKGIFEHFKKKGWIAGYDKGYLLADPKTGEYFGTPRRLETIYRTNMQAAYSSERYQQMRDNADSRPYWQYSAVNDDRTRPSHSAMNGLVYRYDDPFWNVFYPPNGFNCRCSVIALAERDIARRNLVVGNSEERLIDYERKINATQTEKTTAFKLSDDKWVVTDRGFDYNVGRMMYKPNLDQYPEALAHQFAKREMGGEGFKFDFRQFEEEFKQAKQRLNLNEKLTSDDLTAVRNQLRREYKFAAGVLNVADKATLKSETATVWLSDDTLIKQFNSRDGQGFGLEEYALLPDVINQPDKIIPDELGYQFYKQINNKKIMAVLKVLGKENEIFMQSVRFVSEKQWRKAFK